MRITIIAAAAAAFLASFAPAPAEEIEVAAVDVVTADIIRADAKEWRIANIEAPQLDSSCPEEHAFALQARAKLSEILADGKVKIWPAGGHDFQLRDTARVYVNGNDVGEKMIAARMALRRGYGRPWCFAAVVDNTTGAQPNHGADNHVGIVWGQSRPPPPPPPTVGGRGR
jgi:micrococcal nuclease